MKSEAIRCRCGHVICVETGDTITVKFSGRRISVTRPTAMEIICERCRSTNRVVQKNDSRNLENSIDKA